MSFLLLFGSLSQFSTSMHTSSEVAKDRLIVSRARILRIDKILPYNDDNNDNSNNDN